MSVNPHTFGRKFAELAAIVATVALLFGSARSASAQHLWWNADGQKDATCVYGQVTVLATEPGTYYCGINWHPGEPAGGYCGIQHNGPEEKRTIFSIWDTSPTLHPSVTAADPKTEHSRFGGEGEGGHTHMLWPWKLGETFEFYVTKTPSTIPESTDVRYYVYDRPTQKWLHSATITCPNGGFASVGNLSGGGMASFLENFTGQNRSVARLAVYRLWLGKSPENLKPLRHAGGDGQWGAFRDGYFLANGTDDNLKPAFQAAEKSYGKPTFGVKGTQIEPILDKPVDRSVIEALMHLPQAPAIPASKT